MSDPIVISPRNSLKAKVGSGGLPPGVLKQAAQAVEEMCRNVDFGDETRDVMIAIKAHLQQAESDPIHCADSLMAIFDIAHELRGQAATFEFPMVTRVAASLCRFTIERHNLSQLELEITRVHVDAMMRIITDNLRGNSDRLAQQIIAGLEYLVRRREKSQK